MSFCSGVGVFYLYFVGFFGICLFIILGILGCDLLVSFVFFIFWVYLDFCVIILNFRIRKFFLEERVEVFFWLFFY